MSSRKWHRFTLSRGSLVSQMVKNLLALQETQAWSMGWEYHLDKGMATTPIFLFEELHRQEEPGGPKSMGSQRVRHHWVTNTFTSPSGDVKTLDLWCKGHQEQLNVGYCLKWELLESLHNECWDSFLTSFYYLTSTALAIRKISLWARNWNSLHYRISHAQGKSSKKTDIRSSSQGNSPATHPVVMTWKKQSKE